MSAQLPTQTMKVSQVKQGLSALVNRIYRRETRVLVEKSGIPVAGIVSAHDLQRLEQPDRERAEQFKVLEEIGAAFWDVPFEKLEPEIARNHRSPGRTTSSATGGGRRDVIKAVLDTNVLAAGILGFASAWAWPPRSLPRPIIW